MEPHFCPSCTCHVSPRYHVFRQVGKRFYHEACYKRLRRRFIAALVLIGLCLTAGLSYAQTFPLGKAIPDSAFFCFSKDVAIEVAKAAHEPYFEATLVTHLRAGNCGQMAAIFTYNSQVHKGRNGNHVYEATVGKFKVFVPTTWTHTGDI